MNSGKGCDMRKLRSSVISLLIILFVMVTGIVAIGMRHRVVSRQNDSSKESTSNNLVITNSTYLSTAPFDPAGTSKPVKPGWQKKGSSDVFIDKDGKEVSDGVGELDGKFYLIKNGKPQEPGMILQDNNIYYVGEEGLITRTVYGDKSMVALTFDDGPSKYTEQILDVFKEYDARATFFINGEDVESYKNAISREHAEGHVIGNHTQNHKTLTKLSVKDIHSQISQTDDIVYDLCGVKTKYLRPPGGAVDDKVKANVGMPMINWSVDTKDWSHDDAGKTLREIKKSTKDGSIVLMHDRMKSTAAAVKDIVPELLGRGFQLVTIEEMSLLRGGTQPGQVYFSFPP